MKIKKDHDIFELLNQRDKMLYADCQMEFLKRRMVFLILISVIGGFLLILTLILLVLTFSNRYITYIGMTLVFTLGVLLYYYLGLRNLYLKIFKRFLQKKSIQIGSLNHNSIKSTIEIYIDGQKDYYLNHQK